MGLGLGEKQHLTRLMTDLHNKNSGLHGWALELLQKNSGLHGWALELLEKNNGLDGWALELLKKNNRLHGRLNGHGPGFSFSVAGPFGTLVG